MTISERNRAIEHFESEKRRAEFETLLLLVSAIESGTIGKRNRQKMDAKISASIAKFVHDEAP